MTPTLPPYPAYKPSGIPWLGDIPAHWETRPLKRWVRINSEVLPENTAQDYHFQYIDIGSVGTGILLAKPQRMKFGDAPSRARRVLRRGDTIISTVRTYLKAVYFVSDDAPDLIASTGFAVLRPGSDTEKRFVGFLVQSDPFTHRVSANSVGIAYPAIAETRLGTLDVPLPPLPEQTAIARYLDHVDRRIRRTIRAKQKLIKLMTEQKQAIIHQAVTGQIDVRSGRPYPAYKDSGVEWLGQVPEHWEVTRFKFVAKVDGMLVDPRLHEQREKILIAPNHIERGGTARLLGSETADSQGADSGKYEVMAGQIIYTKIRPYLRKAIIAPTDCLCSADMYPVSVHQPDQISTEFLLQVMLSEPFTQYTIDCSLRAAMPKINRNALGDAVVWFPGMDEQHFIIRHIRDETRILEDASDRVSKEIDFIREYRTRLIADVVTGKVDVRAAAANLPEEGDEDEDEEDVEGWEEEDGRDEMEGEEMEEMEEEG